MVEYDIDLEDKEIVQSLRRWQREMPEFTKLLMDRFSQAIAARAAEKSKQVLNVITGRLSTGVFGRRRGTDTAIIGAGANVSYARAHELGFQGTVMVRAHQRRMVFGREVAPFTVPGHARRMNIHARPYVRPSIEQFFAGGAAEDIAAGLFQRQKERHGFE